MEEPRFSSASFSTYHDGSGMVAEIGKTRDDRPSDSGELTLGGWSLGA